MGSNIEQQIKSEISLLNNKVADIRAIIKGYPNDFLNDKVGALKVDTILQECLIHYETMELLMNTLNETDYNLLLRSSVNMWNMQNVSIAKWKEQFEHIYCYMKRGIEDFL